MDFKKMAESSPTFCILPFSHLTTKTTGEIKLCCRSLPLYNVKEKGFFDVWNSERMKEVRKEVLTGQRPKECGSCFELEDECVMSMRERQNILKCKYNDYMKLMGEVNNDYSMKGHPRSIELKLNNLCNIKCRMCHPADSTKWAKDWPHISDLQKSNQWTHENVEAYKLVESPYLCEWKNHPSFFDEIEQMSDSLDTIWFAGGEPLIDPMHYKILDMLKDKGSHISLQYATNLTKIYFKGKSIIDYWKHFNGVLANVSIDGLRDVFNYIRTGADFDKVLDNIRKVNEMAVEQQLNVVLAGACTFQAYNAFNFDRLFSFLIGNRMWVHSHRVTHPRFLSAQVLPLELKEIISERIQKFYYSLKKMTDLEIPYRKNAMRHTMDNLNFMNGADKSEFWPEFVEYSRILDKVTGSKPLIEIIPELKGYI